ncbi:host-nuclease inhibitor Gam family protein [Parasphingorhabdus sp.]|uniref:host-nuclease inhibitor Gam family protein n=1 Tax=Parasphingorhabdus sp. TaxID=2709688 RepID=UPI00359395BD
MARADSICDEQIDQAKALRDENVAVLKPKLGIAFDKLQAYYSANEDALTDGKKRSVELGPVTIGERLTTPKLKLPKDQKDVDIIVWLRSFPDADRFAKRFLREKVELDKQALIAALKSTETPREGQDLMDSEELAKKGLTIKQKDEFFVKLPEEESSGQDTPPAASE